MKTGVLHAGVAEIVEELHTVNSQHHGQRIGLAGLASLGVHGPDSLLQTLPGDQAVHPFQEQFPPGLALLAPEFQFGKCRAGPSQSTPNRHRFIQQYYATSPQTCSEGS